MKLSEIEKRKIIKYIYDILGYYKKNGNLNYLEFNLGFDIDLSSIDYLFVTLIIDGKIIACQSSSERSSLNLNIMKTLERCFKDKRYIKHSDFSISDILVSINFLSSEERITLKEFLNLEQGIYGVKLKSKGKLSVFKDSVQISKNYNNRILLERLLKKAGLNKLSKDDILYKYKSYSFYGNNELEVFDLYRYSIYIEKEIDNNKILKSLKLAKSWLINNLKPNGLLQYCYYPSLSKYSVENNNIRQLASSWIASDIDIFLGEKDLLNLYLSTINYYYKYIENNYCNIGKPVIANNAFFILLLLNYKYYGIKSKINIDLKINDLADGIISRQLPTGEYYTSFYENKNSGIDFFPGESMLSLMKLFTYSKNNKYLKSVESAFYFYKKYWYSNKNTAFVPWQTQALYILYKETKNPDIPKFIFDMNDWLIENFQINSSDYKDNIGGFGKKYPNISTSSFMEGVIDAYELAKLIGDKYHILKYKYSIQSAVRFIIQLQFDEINSFYLTNKHKVIGGFRGSLINNSIRNDYVQHSVAALLKAYNSGIFKKK